MLLYPIKEETWPDNTNCELLYVVATGQILDFSETTLSLAAGEQAKITAGEWATTAILLTGLQFAELSGGNLKLDAGNNPILIDPKIYTNVKPV